MRSATWEGLSDADGRVNEGVIEIYRRLADGGVGLIITGYLAVRSDGRQHTTQLGVDRDELIGGLAELAAVVHKHGGTVVGQIVHCGGQAVREACGGQDPVAPSAVASPGYPELPRELSLAGIRELVGPSRRRQAASATPASTGSSSMAPTAICWRSSCHRCATSAPTTTAAVSTTALASPSRCWRPCAQRLALTGR